MTDKKMYELLNKFANEHTLAEYIKVDISEYRQGYKPREENSPAKYEDCKLLSSIVMGAESFLFWLRRKGYEVKK